MAWYVVRRLLAALVTVWIVATAGFLLVEIIPGDPTRQLAGPGASAATLASIREAYGFDDPLPVRVRDRLGHGDEVGEERQARGERGGVAEEGLQRASLDELHGVEGPSARPEPAHPARA